MMAHVQPEGTHQFHRRMVQAAWVGAVVLGVLAVGPAVVGAPGGPAPR